MKVHYIAHARQDSSENWHSHLLQNHLQKVAQLAKRFAGRYGPLFAEYAGLLHDLGKFQEAFQKYIRNASGFEKENAHLEDIESIKLHKIPHSTAGAKYAVEHLNPFFGHLLAYLITGHHAGLADWYGKGSLKSRLQQADDELVASLSGLVESSLSEDFFPLSDDDLKRDFFAFWKEGAKLEELHIWLRFLFSCLVDADFLDTEAFMNGYSDADAAQAAGLRPKFPGLDELHQRYEQYMAQLHEKSDKDSFLNQERHAILQQSFSAAETDRTLFSLTVPTGGGKTLASLGFALKHALKFDKKRIIYAIPFTSIIEQNANVFRKALGDDVVLEHHSNLEVKEDKETAKTRLATENWDAPLIVTTNVQLFESLFATKTSRCRKIHNIADSVVILDEAQQLPRDFQKPITDMMRVLARSLNLAKISTHSAAPFWKACRMCAKLWQTKLPYRKNCAASASKCRRQTAKCKAGRKLPMKLLCVRVFWRWSIRENTPKNSLPPCLLTESSYICLPICAPRTEAKSLRWFADIWHCIAQAACTSLYGWSARS